MKIGKSLISFLKLTSMLLFPSLGLAEEHSSPSQNWIVSNSGHTATWRNVGILSIPSGSIFIGDPSYGSDYHLRGARKILVSKVDVWLLMSESGHQVHTVWLEANGNLPSRISGSIEFGTDSAYFALGDLTAGNDLANIGDLENPDFYDSFEFFLPHIQDGGFTSVWLDVPPRNAPVLAVETNRDGGLKAIWVEDSEQNFSGILIDITGRIGDNLYLDKLLETSE